MSARCFLGGTMTVLRRIWVHEDFFFFAAIMLLLLPIRWILAGFAAALVHELGHSLAVRLLGGHLVSGQISSRGAKLTAAPMKPQWELAALLAGPAASLLLLFLHRLFPRIAICGFVQGCFNLLPIYPLDGGKALRCVKSIVFSRFERKTPCKEGKQRVQ